jgi:hypothetical protein
VEPGLRTPTRLPGLAPEAPAHRSRPQPTPENRGPLFPHRGRSWKSYANLHQFDTANPHIAAGLIWASLCAAVLKRFLAHAAQRVGAGPAISTRRVAMCAHHFLAAVVAALLGGTGLLAALRRTLTYLLANARRSNPARDRRTGRLRIGLVDATAA